MVASDAEWGLGMRLDSTRSFPRAMTLGATRNPELGRMFGQVVGQSLSATGVHVNFAPVVDVNSNPANPVIGSRSFGESVEWVAKLGRPTPMAFKTNVLGHRQALPRSRRQRQRFSQDPPTISHDRGAVGLHRIGPVPTHLRPRHGRRDGGPPGHPEPGQHRSPTLHPLPLDCRHPCCGEMGFEGLGVHRRHEHEGVRGLCRANGLASATR